MKCTKEFEDKARKVVIGTLKGLFVLTIIGVLVVLVIVDTTGFLVITGSILTFFVTGALYSWLSGDFSFCSNDDDDET